MIFIPNLKWKECSTENNYTIKSMRWRDNSWISHKYIVLHKFVKDYVDHLAQIEKHKEKRRAERERQQT